MGNFFVVAPVLSVQKEADCALARGLGLARSLDLGEPNGMVKRSWSLAASFARDNGSGSPVASDVETGSWLTSIGTWFHPLETGPNDNGFLLDRYLRLGSDNLAQELEGFFTIIVGDGRTGEIIAITDIIGSCHAFMRAYDSMAVLSGSSLLLAAMDGVSLDAVGCQEFLFTGICYENRTLFSEVKKLEPASVYHFRDGRLKSKTRYWEVSSLRLDSLDAKQAVDSLIDNLVAGVRKIHSTFNRPVCDLTGGYDSRAVVAAFLCEGTPFSTTVSGPANSADVLVSKAIALQEHLPHIHVEGDTFPTYSEVKETLRWTDGEYDLLEYARIANLHRRLAERFDVSINGSFGEVGRGYWWELLFPRIGTREKLDARKVAAKRFAPHPLQVQLFPQNTRLDLLSHFTDMIERTNANIYELPNTLQMDHAYLMMRMQRWQGRIASSTNRIWPCFSLFLLRSVLETLLQTRSRFRHYGSLIRSTLLALQPKLAAVPLEHGYPALPVTCNTIHRFWPYPLYISRRITAKALRMVMKNHGNGPTRNGFWIDEEVQEILRPDEMRLAKILDPAGLDNFVSRSKSGGFSSVGMWSKILTIETALRRLQEHATGGNLA